MTFLGSLPRIKMATRGHPRWSAARHPSCPTTRSSSRSNRRSVQTDIREMPRQVLTRPTMTVWMMRLITRWVWGRHRPWDTRGRLRRHRRITCLEVPQARMIWTSLIRTAVVGWGIRLWRYPRSKRSSLARSVKHLRESIISRLDLKPMWTLSTSVMTTDTMMTSWWI